ncbi:probable serine/threonine-protein kinase yakA [Penaeus japonicus]|uniref:probable serine/threonine-protein kinase yakA n=1 Tax=Penaeus japonicus TaxID=27405 RepID=UPI001C70EFE2|nr:probable serine/threonine-protein kinase yakA [Penaeus japonicus]
MNARVFLLTALCSALGRNTATAAGQLNRVGSGGVVYAAAPQERGAYAVAKAGGPYNYGYNTGDGIAKVEVRQPTGTVVGSYRYFDPNGKQVVRSYIADEKGFRVLGNDLPISPDTPASQVLGTPAFTGAIEGTSEFDIPPPLSPNSQYQTTHAVNVPQTQQPQFVQQEALQKQQSAFLQEQQLQYQQQQDQLEEQRRQLRLQQEKLEALQRDLEQQQQKFQLQYEKQTQQHVSPQPVPQPQPSQQQIQYQTQDTYSGGYTSPYYYYPQQYDFDFPAGFAYAGLPVVKAPVGAKRVHPEQPLSAGHTAARVNVHPPVAPHRSFLSHANPITAGHTKSRRHHNSYVIGLAR